MKGLKSVFLLLTVPMPLIIGLWLKDSAGSAISQIQMLCARVLVGFYFLKCSTRLFIVY